jgi:hypothetical protein
MGNRASGDTASTSSEDELMAGLASSGTGGDSEERAERDSMSRLDPELEQDVARASGSGSGSSSSGRGGGPSSSSSSSSSSTSSSSHQRRGASAAAAAAAATTAAGGGEEEKGPGYWAQVKGGYAEAVNAIIRPPRADYTRAELGPAEFEIGGLRYRRTDFVRRNPRGMRVKCSWWEPVPEERAMEKLPCCVYMHGNSSCRGESLEVLPLVLNMGCTMLSFDFCGCGMSDGDFISLGWYERDDCKCVIDYLRATGTVSLIGLWGRSMGAATALMHGHRDNTIAAMILDSSFASLEMLVYELYKRAELKYVPKFMVAVALRVVRSTVLKRAGFDILKLRPCDNVEKCHIPAIFVCAKGDRFIHPAHSETIFENYGGEYKNIIHIDGDHNTNRPRFCMDSIAIFLYQWLCKPTGLTEEFLKEKRADLVGARQGAGAFGGTRVGAMGMGGMGGMGHRMGGGGGGRQQGGMDDDAELQRVLMLSMLEEQRRQQQEQEARKKKKQKRNAGEEGCTEELESGASSEVGNGDRVFEREHADEIAQLANMGFETDSCALALKQTGGNLQMAAQLLIAGGGGGGTFPAAAAASRAATKPSAVMTSGGRGNIAGRLLAAVPQDTRPDAAPVNIFDRGAGEEKQ